MGRWDRRLLACCSVLSLIVCVATILRPSGLGLSVNGSLGLGHLGKRTGTFLKVREFHALAGSILIYEPTPRLLLVVFAFATVLPLWWCIDRAQTKARARKAERDRDAGLCPSCGYDLRASPGRCPECGVAATIWLRCEQMSRRVRET